MSEWNLVQMTGPRTTAASNPTICRMVNSDVLMVGSIQPKKAE